MTLMLAAPMLLVALADRSAGRHFSGRHADQ
jgi:hypothetical protein